MADLTVGRIGQLTHTPLEPEFLGAVKDKRKATAIVALEAQVAALEKRLAAVEAALKEAPHGGCPSSY